MAALILPSRRVVQPQGPVEIDWGDPLTFGQVLDARGDQYFKDAAAGRIPTQTVGAFTKVATSAGFAANLASAVTSFGDVELFSGAQASFQIIDLPDNLTQVSGLLNKRSTATTDNSYSIGYNYVGSEFNVDIGNSAGTNVNLSYRFSRSTFSTLGNNIVVVVDGAVGAGQRIRAFRNGVALSATAATDNAFATFPDVVSPLEIGRVNNGTLYYAGKILLVRAWKRALADGEVKALSENPWQLYRPIQRRIWVPVAGGVVSHATSGALANAGGATSGAADSSTARASSGVLANAGGAVAGTAARTREHPASGVLANPGATTSGNADSATTRTSSGVLANPGAQVVGSANHQAAAVSHATSGALAGPGAVVVGFTSNESGVLIDTHDGFWAKEWARIRAREKRKHREEIEERIGVIADEIAEVEQQIVEVKQAAKPKKATPARDFYAEQARIVEHLISRRNQLIDEEDEELLLLL